MSDTTYQGWSNYPTWAVNLWLANDEGLYREALEQAATAVEEAGEHANVTEGIWTAEQAARFELSDTLRDWVRELVELDEASLRSDLLGHALDTVNWDELAGSWIANAAEINA